MANEAKVAAAAKVEKGNGLSTFFASFTIPLCLLVGILIFTFVMGAPSNFEGNDPANHPVQEGAGHVLGLIHKGGYIVPILLSLVLMNITFSIERYLTIGKAQGKGNAEAFVRKIRAKLDQNDVDGAIKECDAQRGSVANVMRSTLIKYKEMQGLTSMPVDQRIISIQKEIEESVTLELPGLEKNLVVIATMASVSTLIALLGTVLGMIKAFSALATGISEALINTALGIGNSAIATIMYNVFTSKIDAITYAIDEAGYSIVQTFAAKNR